MDALSIIFTALIAGAAAAAEDLAGQALKEAYNALKDLIIQKLGGASKVEAAIDAVEQRPQSEGRKALLREQLTSASGDIDATVIEQAEAFLKLLKDGGWISGSFYQAIVTGSGAAAQAGSVAAGEGGTAVSGDVEGSIYLRRRPQDNDTAGEDVR